MPENVDDNRCFRKQFSKRSHLKTHHFINAPLVDRWKRRLLQTVTKKASYIVASEVVFGRITMDNRQKHIKNCEKNAFSNENVECTDKNETKTIVRGKIFGFVFFEMKTETSKTHYCGQGLSFRLTTVSFRMSFASQYIYVIQKFRWLIKCIPYVW